MKNKAIPIVVVIAIIAAFFAFLVSVNMPRPAIVVPPPIAVVEQPAVVVDLGTIEVPKSIPKKKKSAKCAPAETEAYDWAFFNAYRANALSGKKQWVQGPNPCMKK